jgi:hypothetical protein
MAIMRKGKDQDKNRGSVAERIKEDVARMEAASMSRRQGISNITSKDLEGRARGGSATIKDAPNGKEYMGPAYGEYKAKQKEDKPKAKAKTRQNRGAGREDMMSRERQRMIMEREERKRKNAQDKGGSSVVGS